MYNEVIAMIRGRGRMPFKRNDPFLTFLRVAMIRNSFYVVCVDEF
jgi:hypothetical protein